MDKLTAQVVVSLVLFAPVCVGAVFLCQGIVREGRRILASSFQLAPIEHAADRSGHAKLVAAIPLITIPTLLGMLISWLWQ